MNTDRVLESVLQWYTKNQRIHLPWRKTNDPYRILVSEVMLQQTQVERVISKYKEFLHLFPTVQTLALAPTADVIRAWAGLGYNRRALFLQRTAQTIVEKYGGVFPRNSESLQELPGVGDYTARAILSFAFQKSVPMMDTNHRRFYQRVFFGYRKKRDDQLLQKATQIISFAGTLGGVRKVGATVYRFNQALMDFGSLVCTMRKPLCETCPIQQYCQSYPFVTKTKALKKKGKDAGLSFHETDRYFRGRIIDILREKHRVSRSFLLQQLPEISEDRYVTIIQSLCKDGLIKQKGGSILLP